MTLHMTIPVFLPVACLALSHNAAPNLSDVSRMSDAMTQGSLRSFNEAASSNGWMVPAIPSEWHLVREDGVEKRALNSKARFFGKLAAQRCESWADELLAERNLGTNLAISTELLNFADWISGTPAYGNLILAARAQDIATIGIGRLLVDLSCPFSVVSALVARLDAPWYAADVRAQVLNAETGTNLFRIGVLAASNELNAVWQNGQMGLLKYSSKDVQAAFEGSTQAEHSALSQIIRMRQVKPVESPIIVENLSFFKDDPIAAQGRPVTTLRKWDAKWHGKIVNGLQSSNTRKLKALLVFRQFVGKFPTSLQLSPEQQAAKDAETAAANKYGLKIVPIESMYSSTGESAFAQSWAQYATDETRNLYAPAWKCYTEIQSGQFVDEDSREKRAAAQVTPSIQR